MFNDEIAAEMAAAVQALDRHLLAGAPAYDAPVIVRIRNSIAASVGRGDELPEEWEDSPDLMSEWWVLLRQMREAGLCPFS
jgi:hypothetical protein